MLSFETLVHHQDDVIINQDLVV